MKLNRRTIIFLFIICIVIVSNAFSDNNISKQELVIRKIEAAKTISVFLISTFYIKDQAGRLHEERACGTGFIVDTTKAPGLKVITNRHVLELVVNGQKYPQAKY